MTKVDHININGNFYRRTRSTAPRPEGESWYPSEEQVTYEAGSRVDIKHEPLLSWSVAADPLHHVVMPLWQDKLRHILGAGPEQRKRDHGFRNYYCASAGSDSYRTLREMEQAGLVRTGVFINGGRDQYFHATLKGCKAIGLSKAAIERAFED